MCMYVCMYVYTCMYVYVSVYVYVCVCVYRLFISQQADLASGEQIRRYRRSEKNIEKNIWFY